MGTLAPMMAVVLEVLNYELMLIMMIVVILDLSEVKRFTISSFYNHTNIKCHSNFGSLSIIIIDFFFIDIVCFLKVDCNSNAVLEKYELSHFFRYRILTKSLLVVEEKIYN